MADISRKLKKNECFIQFTEHSDVEILPNNYRQVRPRAKVNCCHINLKKGTKSEKNNCQKRGCI